MTFFRRNISYWMKLQGIEKQTLRLDGHLVLVKRGTLATLEK